MADNTTSSTKTDFWAEADGGFRSSAMMRLGSIVAICAVLFNFAIHLLAAGGTPSQTAFSIAWLLYMAALWLLAGAFFWVGSQPFLGRSGLVVGLLHGAQAGYLLALLFSQTSASVPPIGLTLLRLLALFGFVWLERNTIDQRTRMFLWSAAGLQLAKVIARSLGLWPDLGPQLNPLLDALTMAPLAVALFQLGKLIRRAEDRWAHEVCHARKSALDDFNNPEHSWNKEPSRQ